MRLLNKEQYRQPYEEDYCIDKSKELDAKFFDPEAFRVNAEVAVKKLEKYLSDTSIKGLSLIEPSVLMKKAKKLMTEKRDGIYSFDEKKFGEIIDLYISTGIQVHSPGYMGRQFSGVIPLAGIFDLINSIVNQPSSFYEAGQLPNVAERIMAEEFNRFIGWEKDSFTMVTTSGGSLANLTALLAARNDKMPRIWSEGVSGLEGVSRPAIAVSEEAHYSVFRAAGILGIGSEQIVKLPTNSRKQICLEKVLPTIEAAEKKGLKIFCIVASAGTTSFGAFDPINELADIAREKNMWIHVDGAHGGSFLVSDKLRHKLAGIEKVDSFSLDAHKTMFVPAMCTLLFYRNKEKSFGAFHQEASYVFEKKPDVYTEFDSAEKNFECTKRPMIMNLWVVWALYGRTVFEDKINYLYELTQNAYRILSAESDFETLHKPEANILCFRYIPPNLPTEEASDFQIKVRNLIKKRGKFFISKVDIDGKGALRVVFMNHKITMEHFRKLLFEIRRTGQELLNMDFKDDGISYSDFKPKPVYDILKGAQ